MGVLLCHHQSHYLLFLNTVRLGQVYFIHRQEERRGNSSKGVVVNFPTRTLGLASGSVHHNNNSNNNSLLHGQTVSSLCVYYSDLISIHQLIIAL